MPEPHWSGRNPANSSGGGAAESAKPTVLLRAAALNAGTTGDYMAKWNAIYDNQVNENTLDALPSGLGLVIPTDGSSEYCSASEDGLWYMEFYDYGSTNLGSPMTAELSFRGVGAGPTGLVEGQTGRHTAIVPMHEGDGFRTQWRTTFSMENPSADLFIYPALLIARL